jgi:hypothetical protein
MDNYDYNIIMIKHLIILLILSFYYNSINYQLQVIDYQSVTNVQFCISCSLIMIILMVLLFIYFKKLQKKILRQRYIILRYKKKL